VQEATLPLANPESKCSLLRRGGIYMCVCVCVCDMAGKTLAYCDATDAVSSGCVHRFSSVTQLHQYALPRCEST
jgi:hypothetical protein